MTFNCRDSFSGYGAKNGGGGLDDFLPDGAGGDGGSVEFGLGELSAYTLAAAKLSA